MSCSRTILESDETCINTYTTKANLQENTFLYNTSAKAWMKRQYDPYDISNLCCGDTICATHYAMKAFPKSEEELNGLIQMNDIIISYIPFGFTYLSDSEATEYGLIPKLTNTYHEDERYYVEYESERGSKRVPLPILYISWPISKQIPEGLEYEIAYSACLPDTSSNETDILGQRFVNNLRGSSYRTISGFVLDYDSLLAKYVPVKNLRIRVSYGLSCLEDYTNQAGHFSITGNINDNATVSIVYENAQWRITANSLFTYVYSLGTVQALWGSSGTNTIIRRDLESQAIHRGANFFYNGNHDLVTPASSYSLRIDMLENNKDNYFQPEFPMIHVQLANYFNDSQYIYRVIHELGHFNHYQLNGGYFGYISTPLLIRESYASYVAWYLSREYYTQLNSGVYDNSWESYLAPSQQYWYYTMASIYLPYSPLFIDLIDDLDQSTLYSSYPLNVDTITGFSHSMIPTIVINKTTWNSLRTYLQGYIGSYFSSSDFDLFVEPYDYYFENN